MSKARKAIDRLCAKPPPSDFKWEELKTLLERLGYKMLSGKGSRRKFFHEKTKALIICHQPHPTPNVDKGCIANVVDHLRQNGFIR